MGRRHRSIELDAYRRGLDGAGEVRIGAYARRVRRRRALLGLLGLVLMCGAVGLYWVLRPEVEPAALTYPVKVRCTSCGRQGTLDVPSGQTFPLICPQCGEKTYKPVWKCRACGDEFVPRTEGGSVRCPACGSLEVGSAAVP